SIAPLSRVGPDGAKPRRALPRRRDGGPALRARKKKRRGLCRASCPLRVRWCWSAHLEFAAADRAAVLRHLQAVAAGWPAVGLADVEVGDLRAGGDVFLLFGHDLVAVEVGPPGLQPPRRAVGFYRGVNGVAAGEGGLRRGDA